MIVTPQMMEKIAKETHQFRARVYLDEPGARQIRWIVCDRCGQGEMQSFGPMWCPPCPASAWGR